MVRFLCFNPHAYHPKPKKTVQSSSEAMHKNIEDRSQVSIRINSAKGAGKSFLPEKREDAQMDRDVVPVAIVSAEEMKGENKFDTDVRIPLRIRKSLSLGGGLCDEGSFAFEQAAEDESDHRFCSDFQNLPNENQNAQGSESVQLSSHFANNGSIFSIGDCYHSAREGHGKFESPPSAEFANDSGDHTPPADAQPIVKSRSLPNIVPSAFTSSRCSSNGHVAPRSRSFNEQRFRAICQKEARIHSLDMEGVQKDDWENGTRRAERHDFENGDACDDSSNYSALAKDWVMPIADGSRSVKNLEEESSPWDESTSDDFKFKRIEEWVNDLQHCSRLEETEDISYSSVDLQHCQEPFVVNCSSDLSDAKITPGMEAAKRYISSMSVSATTAHLANHGLLVIPFLSAFASLRVLNLSGNAIGSITAGALPRGLHTLNLSKNNISTIEGLRALSRLRVLDLSYNRIIRIGHGLASCSALKELYLAGNKISEAEGLHRLLKLTVLDLRYNKICTTKCLGQLAANYNSLQAISLEGNPAQKNVGDEQLKKYLQGLLPQMSYFNRQPIKISTLKDSSDRPVRLGTGSSNQFDRGLRGEHKVSRKSSHGGSHRQSSPSTHSRKNSTNQVKSGRHGRLPAPIGTRAAAVANQQQYFDFGGKIRNLKSDLSMRRIQSEGTLGSLW